MDLVGQALRDRFDFGLHGRGQYAARLRLLRCFYRLNRSDCGRAEKIELIFRLARFDVYRLVVQSAFS